MQAQFTECVSIMMATLAAGADVNAVDARSRATLHSAIDVLPVAAVPPIARVLLDAGADITIAARDGETTMGECLAALRATAWDCTDEEGRRRQQTWWRHA